MASTSSPWCADELLEVALPVRDEPDLQPVPAELVEHRQRVLVEREVLVPLPLAHHVGRARPRASASPPMPTDDLLGEGDPDLLVVHELAVALELVDRGARAPS